MTGKELLLFRLSLNLCQREFANEIGYSESAVCRFEGKLNMQIGLYIYKYLKLRWPEKFTEAPHCIDKYSQPRSPIYNMIYPAAMQLRPLSEEICAKLYTAENEHRPEKIIVPHAVFAGLKKNIRKNMHISCSETTLSVGDMSSQCLLNTGSNSYRKMITWLEGV